MEITGYSQKFKIVKRKTTEYSTAQEDIVKYFKDKRITYSVVGLWINQIGVKDVGELFRQVQKFDSKKYSMKYKANWLMKQIRISWADVQKTLKTNLAS